ncbi:MAG TPA: glycosyltransferase family 4 protein, partial [Lacibacter sp.]|nr:glycosyltransferase family 4 protein [Lacibacter sp.]
GMKKLAIITSHPIQYNAPLFRLLTERKKVAVKVFYTWGQTKEGLVYDPDFKKAFRWDLPLTEGYESVFIENIARNPGAGHFNGIQNKDLIPAVLHYQPDALLVYGWSFQSHLQLLRYFKGKVKILFRGDSTLLDEPPGFSFRKLARRLFLKQVYKGIDYCLYTGKDNQAYFLKHGIKEHSLKYAPHAVDNDRFFDHEGAYAKAAAAWRAQLQIPADAIVFLFAGKLEPKKDPLLLIECFQQLKADNIRLIITGNGVLEEKAKQMAGDDVRILFLDFQNQQQMPVLYRLGDIFVLPSKGPGETWGLSVNEAMACSRPVLVSHQCGCAKDLVQDNGSIFEAGNIHSLKAAMNAFLLSKNEMITMAQKSRSLIEHFSYDAVAEAIESIV